MDYNVPLVQQGWQCPICKRVYSPTTSMCYYCSGETTTTTTNNFSMTIGDYISQNSGNWYWRIVNRFSFIIANIFRTLSLMWVCEVLSPNHQSILKAFEFVVLTAFSLAKESISGNIKDNLEFYIIELICCFFLMFASIIHNEIIVINRCNLMKSTDFLKSQINKIDDEIKNIELWRKEGEDKNKNEEEENILLGDMSSNQSFENGNEEK